MRLTHARRRDWMLAQLPMGMLDDDFFVRFVSLFQHVATTLLDDADNVANVVDVTVAPIEFVRWLGSWIGLDSIDPSLPEDLQRRLVQTAASTMAWRGTAEGLRTWIEAVTGAPVTVHESGRTLRDDGDLPATQPWVRIDVASTGWLTNRELAALVADEVPANVVLEIWLGSERLWPPAAADAAGVGVGGARA